MHCNTLQHSATQCGALQHIATQCGALQHSAAHCNIVRRIATCRYQGGQGANEDDTEYTSYDIGEECLDRLAIALGGKTVLPIAFSGIPHGTAYRLARYPAWPGTPSGGRPFLPIAFSADKQRRRCNATPLLCCNCAVYNVQTSVCRAFSQTPTGVTAMRAV